jgi:hypothetical protein
MKVEETDRDRTARVVAEYFRCVVEGRLQDLPITTDYGSESPQSGRVQGATAVTYLGSIGAEMTDIRVMQHIVEGDFVATYFEGSRGFSNKCGQRKGSDMFLGVVSY